MPRRRKEPLIVLLLFVLLEVGLLGLLAYTYLLSEVEIVERAVPFSRENLLLVMLILIALYFLYVQLRARRLQERIVGEKIKTQTVLEALPTGVLVMDDDGMVVSANSAACRMLGADPVACLGQVVDPYLDDEFTARLKDNFAGTSQARSRSGTPLKVHVRRLPGEAGRIMMLEESTRAAPAAVPAPSSRPATDLSWIQRLGAALARAVESDLPAEVRVALADALVTWGRLRCATMGDDVPAAPQRTSTPLSTVLAGPAERARPMARAREIELRVEADPEARAFLDAGWIERLVDELLLNACSHAGERGLVQLRASTGGTSTTIVVQDTGPGIPPEELPRVTESGFVGGRQTPISAGGRGQGLWVARRIAEAHGGSMRVESREGVGTRVTVTLPAS